MEKEEWEQTLRRKKGGALYAHLFNVYTVLVNHPDWDGVIGRDESGSVVLLKRHPFGSSGPGKWIDTHYSRTRCWLNGFLGTMPAAGIVREAVSMVAEDSQRTC